MFKGKVKIISKGRMMALTTPSTTDPTIAPQTLTSNPDKSDAVKMIARTFNIHRNIQPGTIASSFLMNKIA